MIKRNIIQSYFASSSLMTFQSLDETIDRTKANGELIFHLPASMTQFERSLIVARTQANLVAAKKRGVRQGRPPALKTAQINHARKRLNLANALLLLQSR